MNDVPNRSTLATVYFVGEGVELGVAGGDFSRAIITKGRCTRLWSIDRWNDHHNLREYRDAAAGLAVSGGGRCIPLRMTFSEAALLFDDASLDFVYIDGYAHTGQDGGKTLEEWWPKLKPGGIFSGHDYHADFPLTIDAVDSFMERHGLTIELTGEVKYPSWWTTKPMVDDQTQRMSQVPVISRRQKLTIGMCCFDDFDGVYFTVQSLRLHHPEAMSEVEFLILDTNPESEHGKAVKRFCEWVKEPMRYVPVTDGTGTSTRGRIFDMADTPYVLCVDCHVLLAPGALRKLIDGMDAGHDLGCLLQGPMLYDNITMATHMAHVWRSGMLGIWAVAWRCPCGSVFQSNKRETPEGNRLEFRTMLLEHMIITECLRCSTPLPLDVVWEGHERVMEERGYSCAAEGDAFVIPAHGLGLFTCRKDSWLGFHPQFRGFGGEECYIHEKFRQAGKGTICLPFLRWMHRFERPNGAPYPSPWEARIRNYLLGHRELGMDPQGCLEHFANHLGRKITVTWEPQDIKVTLV